MRPATTSSTSRCIYAIAREGIARLHPDDTNMDLEPLFATIVQRVPAPVVDEDGPFQMLVTTLDYDDYKGKYAIGRITRGSVRPRHVGCPHHRVTATSSRGRIGLVFTYQGLGRLEVPEASAGDIVALTGIADANISDTLADAEQPEALPTHRHRRADSQDDLWRQYQPLLRTRGQVQHVAPVARPALP